MARGSGSKAIQIRAEVPHTFAVVSSMDMRRTSLGSAPMDPRMGPSPCAHLHIGAWLLLMGLSEGPEK